MNWIYALSWQEWIGGALFLLCGAIYLYKLNAIALHLKTTPHTRVYLKFILRCLVLAGVVIALLGPSFGYLRQDQVTTSKNWLVYVDVSRSMDAQDIKPSRLEEARQLINRLLEQHPGDQFALSAFAPAVQILCPLTSDRDAFQLFSTQLSTRLFAHPGTNARTVFSEMYNLLYAAAQEDLRPQSSIVLLITDGEFHNEVSPSTLQSLRKLPYHYIVVGCGTTEPSPIPLGKTFVNDEQGKKVMSSLDREGLKQLAYDLHGKYFDYNQQENLVRYGSTLPGLDRKQELRNTSINKYFYFLGLSVLFMVLDIVITVKTMTI